MKNFILTLSILITTVGYSQTAQQEINEQVWKPFTKAIVDRDPEAFMSLHSKDIIRAERDGKKVLNYDQYKKGMDGWAKRKEYNKTNNIQSTFELRFLERISNESQAFEVGYFKNETINAAGEKRTGYGQFHVALRKENGVWKILVDSDSSNNRTITEEMFQAASPIK